MYTVEENFEDICREKQYSKNSEVISEYGVTFGYNAIDEGVE